MKTIGWIITRASMPALIFLAGCVTSNAAQMSGESNVHARLDDYCKGINNSFECAQAIERIQLPKYAEFVERKGDTLVIRLKNGQSRQIKNRGKPGDLDDSVTFYSFRDYFSDEDILVVEVQHWEGGAYLLINAMTGKERYIDDIGDVLPVPSRSLAYDPG